MKGIVVIGAAIIRMTVLSAYEWPEKASCKLLETSDTSRTANGGSAFTNGVHWSGGTLPTPMEDCWVPNGKTIYAVAAEFPGKSLTVEGSVDASGITMTVPNFRFLGGSTLSFDNVPCGFTADSVVTFQSTAANPVIVNLNRNKDAGTDNLLLRKFVSDEESLVVFRQTKQKPALCPRWTYCDLTEYYGVLRFDRTAESLKGTMLATNTIKSVAITTPGSVEIGNGVVFVRGSADASFTAGKVTVESGALLDTAAINGSTPFFNVTEHLSVNAGARYRANAGNKTIGKYDTADFQLFGLSGDAAKDENLPSLENLELVGLPSPDYNYWGEDRLAITDFNDGSEGRAVAYRSGRPIRRIVNNVGSEKPFENETSWENGAVATATDNAVAGAGITITTWVGAKAGFGGLVLENGAKFAIDSMFVMTNLFVGGASVAPMIMPSTLASYDPVEWRDLEQASVLTGNFLGVYGNLECVGALGREVVVDIPVHGSGTISAALSKTSSQPRGGVEFSRANADFSGKFVVCSDNASGKTNSVNGSRLRFYMTNAQNVGGPMPVPTFDGFAVRGDSIVIGRNSLDFAQENRGVFIGDRARFVMQHPTDNVLTFRCPVTFGGELVFGNDFPDATYAKVGKGCGTLVMGGSARFYDETTRTDCDEPVAGRDRLTMLTGKLRPESRTALDGLEIVFGEESGGIELDWNATGDMKDFGLYDVKSSVPFVTRRTDGKIPVSFASMPETLSEKVVRNVCTVSADIADEVCAQMRVVSRPKGTCAKLTVVPNDDATTTICATFDQAGLVLIFR